MSGAPKNPALERANTVVIGAMGALWFTPVMVFWGAAFGPLRPYDYGPVEETPSLLWFLAGLAASFAPCLLPRGYHQCREGAPGMRVYRALGVHWFRRFATNGDVINRLGRRADPRHRAIRDVESARVWLEHTVRGERSHLVLLLMGLFSALYAARLGWHGWVLALTLSNVVFNLYPVLLQRYNRCRLERLLRPRR